MNRPLQLDGYLKSARRCLYPCPEITVLFRATTPFFAQGYETVARQHPDVCFKPESDFASQIAQWLSRAGPLVVFGYDDVVFVRNIDIAKATVLLREEQNVLACSLRLGCNIRFSHSSPHEIPRPNFQRLGDLLVWNWRQETSHWHYAFELNGTIYRRAFLIQLFNGMEQLRRKIPAADWRHPNLLEMRGNEWLHQTNGVALMCCPIESALIVPTVNCVQTLVDNPLQGECQDVTALETKRREGWQLDLDAFQNQQYDRIHIGNFFLHRPTADANNHHPIPAPDTEKTPVIARRQHTSNDTTWIRRSQAKNPAVSVIMAAWQAEPFLASAIRSILDQPGISLELIVVDDASTDNTLQAALDFDDSRLTVGRMPARLEAGAVRNCAISQARAPWICVFDADDVMKPNTLADYFHTVTANPDRNWAYCGLQLTDAEGRNLNLRIQTPFELLRMLKRNIIAHPMSLYTRALFDLVGGYSENLPRQQDLDLWLRCLFFAEPFFYNRICVNYRRHPAAIGERVHDSSNIDSRVRLRELADNCSKYRDAPRAELIRVALDFFAAWEHRRWEKTRILGQHYAGLGGAGFELERRRTEAAVGLELYREALDQIHPWIQKLASGAPCLPHERLWIIITSLNLARATGQRELLASLLPLADLIHAQQPAPELTNALRAARTAINTH